MGKFNFLDTEIKDLYVIEPTVFEDGRGYFMETYNEEFLPYVKHLDGSFATFIQDNQSRSKKGVLRGLHFQIKKPQGKLVRVIEGEVFDVAVDLRADSESYGKWFGVLLSSENKKQIYIPEGFAHGFLVMSDFATFVYKCTNAYSPDDEGGIIYNDEDIGIVWPNIDTKIILSDKDKRLPKFKEISQIF